ncbi:hypothetical protein ES708_15952 [subsurface metagenome]
MEIKDFLKLPSATSLEKYEVLQYNKKDSRIYWYAYTTVS